ncbi:MAG: hypothetical protein MZV70_05650 [Desulfobacterales bacterium]|nr:hypothetical protein [Desulfobacterales bacterium]
MAFRQQGKARMQGVISEKDGLLSIHGREVRDSPRGPEPQGHPVAGQRRGSGG